MLNFVIWSDVRFQNTFLFVSAHFYFVLDDFLVIEINKRRRPSTSAGEFTKKNNLDNVRSIVGHLTVFKFDASL